MTRQKKELIKAIQRIDDLVEADIQLGCGFSQPSHYTDAYAKQRELYEELARLQHYESAEEMFHDNRPFA